MTARRQRKRLPGWRRRPLLDCPICCGRGSIFINVYGPCGGRENSMPLPLNCPCVQLPCPRGTTHEQFLAQLVEARDEMLAVEREYSGGGS